MGNAVAINTTSAPTFAELRTLVYAAIKIHPANVEDGSNASFLLGALDFADLGSFLEAEDEAEAIASVVVGTDDEDSYMAALSAFCDYTDSHELLDV